MGTNKRQIVILVLGLFALFFFSVTEINLMSFGESQGQSISVD